MLDVLVVEDEPVNQFVIKSMLEEINCNAHCVENGLEALDYLQTNSLAVDLVLMDISMPIMDGIEATQRIREDDKLKEIPIVILTAHALPEVKMRALDVGVDDCLTKPIVLANLTKALSKYMPEPTS